MAPYCMSVGSYCQKIQFLIGLLSETYPTEFFSVSPGKQFLFYTSNPLHYTKDFTFHHTEVQGSPPSCSHKALTIFTATLFQQT